MDHCAHMENYYLHLADALNEWEYMNYDHYLDDLAALQDTAFGYYWAAKEQDQ